MYNLLLNFDCFKLPFCSYRNKFNVMVDCCLFLPLFLSKLIRICSVVIAFDCSQEKVFSVGLASTTLFLLDFTLSYFLVVA